MGEQGEHELSVQHVEKMIHHASKTAEEFGVQGKGNELALRYEFVDPVLRALGWRIHSPAECRLEFKLGWRGQVDYALLDSNGAATVLINVEKWPARRRQHRHLLWRRVGGLRGGLAVLTDGLEWEIYDLSLRARSLDAKRVVWLALDVEGEASPNLLASLLHRWLARENHWLREPVGRTGATTAGVSR